MHEKLSILSEGQNAFPSTPHAHLFTIERLCYVMPSLSLLPFNFYFNFLSSSISCSSSSSPSPHRSSFWQAQQVAFVVWMDSEGSPPTTFLALIGSSGRMPWRVCRAGRMAAQFTVLHTQPYICGLVLFTNTAFSKQLLRRIWWSDSMLYIVGRVQFSDASTAVIPEWHTR